MANRRPRRKSSRKPHPSSRPRSSIKARKNVVKYNFRTRPLIPPTRYRFLNEYNFPCLTQTINDQLREHLFEEDAEESDYIPKSPTLSSSSPRPIPSPSPRGISPISTPDDIEDSYFGLEIITRPSTPEPRIRFDPSLTSPSVITPTSSELEFEHARQARTELENEPILITDDERIPISEPTLSNATPQEPTYEYTDLRFTPRPSSR
ncbi:hypothetical protein EV127DRAFT_248101 [Xylaria flabelliformis]|nr:hypothetical protein EV127DRAFT_248101 [Xylaria flabelliformis]